jgi:hypothetical protein
MEDTQVLFGSTSPELLFWNLRRYFQVKKPQWKAGIGRTQ